MSRPCFRWFRAALWGLLWWSTGRSSLSWHCGVSEDRCCNEGGKRTILSWPSSRSDLSMSIYHICCPNRKGNYPKTRAQWKDSLPLIKAQKTWSQQMHQPGVKHSRKHGGTKHCQPGLLPFCTRGRLLGPADSGNVIVLGECVQVSLEVLHSLLVGF